MNTCVKCLTGLNIPVTGNGMLKKKLDEAEAAYDEWNEGFQDESDYDVELQDTCIDYTLTQDDDDDETC